MNQLKTIGLKLRQARKHKGLTLEKLSELSGVSRITIIRAERGSHQLGLCNLFSIADVLEISHDFYNLKDAR